MKLAGMNSPPGADAGGSGVGEGGPVTVGFLGAAPVGLPAKLNFGSVAVMESSADPVCVSAAAVAGLASTCGVTAGSDLAGSACWIMAGFAVSGSVLASATAS